MHTLNHYSAPILAAFLLVGGAAVVFRRAGWTRGWFVLGICAGLCLALWWVLRPVAKPATAPSGTACLLEVQSPYCLGCLALKPAVDRLEATFRGNLVVRRVDIQSDEGARLTAEYGIEFTPTFIFFDAAGREQWRSVGHIDATTVRNSLPDAGNLPQAR